MADNDPKHAQSLVRKGITNSNKFNALSMDDDPLQVDCNGTAQGICISESPTTVHKDSSKGKKSKKSASSGKGGRRT